MGDSVFAKSLRNQRSSRVRGSGSIETRATRMPSPGELWKDADPDIPIFTAAKSEYAKLK